MVQLIAATSLPLFFMAFAPSYILVSSKSGGYTLSFWISFITKYIVLTLNLQASIPLYKLKIKEQIIYTFIENTL